MTVRCIGAGVPYADGSESELLDIMQGVDDVSSGSDDLDARIDTWATRYHLSHQRSNLLRPLQVDEGMRVLDVGAGTGTMARYLGERGAHVMALEGSLARAEVAAERCRDLPDVEVVCGTIDDLAASEEFDLITVIGVLEYSAAASGGGGGPDLLLAAVRDHLADGGAMALAIENQFGLKYLLGGAEDHHGLPWVGLEGYPGPPGARTWSRRELAGMIRQHGMGAQRWLVPFPDYKLPTIVVHEQLYERVDAAELLDQLVLQPVSFLDAAPVRLGDAAAAHRALLRGDLGLEVSSSFLVVASPDDEGPARLVRDDTLAWLFGGHRRSPWRRHRRLTTDRTVVSDRQSVRMEGWLIQDPGPTRSYEPGRTLGQNANDALRAHDLPTFEAVLGRWWKELLTRAETADGPPATGETSHPFRRTGSRRVLTDGLLDVGLANFVDRDGTLVYIDDEWRACGPVDLDMVVVRALWVLSHEVVTSGIHHPWGEEATVRDLFDVLTSMVDLDVPSDLLDDFLDAEESFQLLVSGGEEEHLRDTWLNGSIAGFEVRPDRRLARELDHLRSRVPQLESKCERVEAQRREMAGQRDHYEGLAAGRQVQLEKLQTVRGFVRARLARSAFVRRLAGRHGPGPG